MDRRRRTILGGAAATVVALAAAMPALATTAVKPYAVPVGIEYDVTPLFSVDDSVPETSDPSQQYRMVGIPDGLGAHSNGDGTTTLFMNHEFTRPTLSQPVVGGPEYRGAYVSKWILDAEGNPISGERAFAMAGVTHRDVDHIMLYDAFTSGPPIMLESLGFAKRGEGVNFFQEGRSTPGGSLPINTNGGGLSYTHTGMYGIFPIIEATPQVRSECGLRQVSNLRASLVMDRIGGMLSSAGTLVLWNDHMR